MSKTNEQMLEELIKLAVDMGWDGLEMWSDSFEVSCDEKWVWILYEEGDGESMPISELFFNHDFARAVFGEDTTNLLGVVDNSRGVVEPIAEERWQYHLIKLAITPEDERIKYAWENRREQ